MMKSINNIPPTKPPMIASKSREGKAGGRMFSFVYMLKENDEDLSNLGVNTVIV